MKYEDVDEYHAALAIDKDDLERCLMEQSESFYHVARETAYAAARRDASKYDLESAEALQGQKIRLESASDKQRVTEAAIAERLAILPNIQKLNMQLLKDKAHAEAWTALKEAFQQRSFMLRELVALRLRQHYDIAMEHGSGQTRAALGDAAVERVREARRARKP